MLSSVRSGSSETDFRTLLGERGETHWWHVGMRSVTRAVAGAVRGRVLDVGCGPGLELGELRASAWGLGVDLVAGPVLPSRFVLADGERLPLRAGSFDVVIVLDVLEQGTVQPVPLLAEVRRVLGPSGRVLIRVPAHPRLYGPHDVFWGGARRYRRSELRREVEAAGLRVRRLTYADSLLFPFAAGVRLLARRVGTGADDMIGLPVPVERLLLAVFRLEASWLRRWDLPFGLSLLCMAEAPQQHG